MSDDLLAKLNPAQREAVLHQDGPMLILAGPGSGKTRVVTHRIAQMLRNGVAPRELLALTFTNKAADEMRSRLQTLAPGQAVWMGTFHRFCARLLRMYADRVGLSENFSILDVDDSRVLLRQAIEEARVELEMITPDKLAQAISWAKNNLVTPEQYDGQGRGPWDGLVAKVYPAYQKRLLVANAVDFDDLLLHSAVLLRENPDLRRSLDARHRYIMVDEYQDTNLAQYAIVRALSIDHPNLAVTGDPDQSIYGWRGANLSNILDFEHDYPAVKVVRLEQNYRSTPTILRVADELISHNVRRKPKSLITDNPEGRPVRLVEYLANRDEAESIATRIAADVRSGRRRAKDFALFYRVNSLSRSYEEALRRHRLPLQVVHGVEFYQRAEIKDLLSFLHLANNPKCDAAVLRVINVPTRGIGKTSVGKLAEHARDHGLSLLDAARQSRRISSLNQRATSAIARFVEIIDRLCESATAPVEEILGRVFELTGYRSQLEKSNDPDDADRLANVQELLTAAREHDMQNPTGAPLESFLEHASLVNDTDDLAAVDDKVTLMTLHGAKGLEFPVVFIVAVEEGLLPHERSKDDPAQCEEERRLLFVGVTRAREELQLSYSRYRDYRGAKRPTVPSSFLMELPRAEMEIVEAPSDYYAGGDRDLDDFQDDDDFDEGGRGDADESSYFEDEPASRGLGRRRPAAGEDDDAIQFDPDDLPPRGSKRSTARSGSSPSSFSHDSTRNFSYGSSSDSLSGQGASGAPSQGATPKFGGITSRLVTAASLMKGAGGGGDRVSPDLYEQGMLVDHPEYGRGRIIALSGDGLKRKASVRFVNDGAERTFRLQFAPLVPVSG